MSLSDRTRILLGDSGIDALSDASVCVFGLGGVGAAAAIDLVRAGVGRLFVVDFDTIEESNLNRLCFGYRQEIGLPKVGVFSDYARRINPDVGIESVGTILRGSEAAEMIPEDCDFYLDCIDTLNPKVNLLCALATRDKLFASAMGTAGRIAPELLKVGSLWKTHDCPLAAVVRKRLHRRGFDPEGHEKFLCVWSDEPAVKPVMPLDGSIPGQSIDGERIRVVHGSGPFVPQAAGHILASLACRSILGML